MTKLKIKIKRINGELVVVKESTNRKEGIELLDFAYNLFETYNNIPESYGEYFRIEITTIEKGSDFKDKTTYYHKAARGSKEGFINMISSFGFSRERTEEVADELYDEEGGE